MRIDIKRIGMYAERVGWLAKEANESEERMIDFLNDCLDLLDELYNSEAEIRRELDRLLPEL